MELEMSWDRGGASLVSQKRKKLGPVGLRNLGNSCYLNSVLQCLTHTPPLANFCLRKLHSSLCDSSSERKRECPFCMLEKRIWRSLSSDLALDAPMKIQSCLRVFSDQFRHGRQEDAHEFLRYVIEACHNTASASAVREIFGGALQSQVKCLSCGSDSNKVDDIMDVSLDILHSDSLHHALQTFFRPEVLDGNNKYRCQSCKKLVAARKQMSVLQAPNILVIQLKRFEGVFGVKIDKSIAFEEVLVLSTFMCKASKDPWPEYKLFGTIVHSGFSPESGHYYAYIKDAMGRWYCCNDSVISPSTVQEVLSEKVYMLFFSRTNQRPASASISPASAVPNGMMKPRDSNGHEASKNLKPDRSISNGVNRISHEQCPGMNMITVTETDKATNKIPSTTPIKFSIGASTSKGPSVVSNGKISNMQPVKANGDAKEVTFSAKIEKSAPPPPPPPPPPPSGNGLTNDEESNGDHSQRSQASVSTNGCNTSQSEKINTNEVNGMNGELTRGRETDHRHDMANGIDNLAKMSGSKRKSLERSCILLEEDAQSREKVAHLKNALAKEAALVLRSCGWSDKVYSFMSSRKILRTQESGSSQLTSDELRKLLIVDAKSTFLSQIPESLKGDLIGRLLSFSRGK